MKAEHRKELKTNELADWLGRTYENLRSGNRSFTIGAGVVALLLILSGVYVYFLSGPSSGSTLFAKLNEATEPSQLQELADKNPGTLVARTARFEIARINYDEGVRDLASATDRPGAVAKLLKARNLYDQLVGDCKDNPLLAQEAMMWTARAEEALIGAFDPDTKQPAGSIDRAIEYYQRLAGVVPETFQTKAAALRAKFLQDKRAQIQAFYAELNKQQAPKLKK